MISCLSRGRVARPCGGGAEVNKRCALRVAALVSAAECVMVRRRYTGHARASVEPFCSQRQAGGGRRGMYRRHMICHAPFRRRALRVATLLPPPAVLAGMLRYATNQRPCHCSERPALPIESPCICLILCAQCTAPPSMIMTAGEVGSAHLPVRPHARLPGGRRRRQAAVLRRWLYGRRWAGRRGRQAGVQAGARCGVSMRYGWKCRQNARDTGAQSSAQQQRYVCNQICRCVGNKCGVNCPVNTK